MQRANAVRTLSYLPGGESNGVTVWPAVDRAVIDEIMASTPGGGDTEDGGLVDNAVSIGAFQRKAEKLVFRLVLKQTQSAWGPSAPNHQVEWLNETEDANKPFDIRVSGTPSNSHDVIPRLIAVKTAMRTPTAPSLSFRCELNPAEIVCAFTNACTYEIWYVEETVDKQIRCRVIPDILAAFSAPRSAVKLLLEVPSSDAPQGSQLQVPGRPSVDTNAAGATEFHPRGGIERIAETVTSLLQTSIGHKLPLADLKTAATDAAAADTNDEISDSRSPTDSGSDATPITSQASSSVSTPFFSDADVDGRIVALLERAGPNGVHLAQLGERVPDAARRGMPLKSYLMGLPGVSIVGEVGYFTSAMPIPPLTTTMLGLPALSPSYGPIPTSKDGGGATVSPTVMAAEIQQQLKLELRAAGYAGLLMAQLGPRVPVECRGGLSLKAFLLSIPGVTVDGHTVRMDTGNVDKFPVVAPPVFSPAAVTRIPSDERSAKAAIIAQLRAAGPSGLLMAQFGLELPTGVRSGQSVKQFLLSIPGVTVSGHHVRYEPIASPFNSAPNSPVRERSFGSPPSSATASLDGRSPQVYGGTASPSSYMPPKANLPRAANVKDALVAELRAAGADGILMAQLGPRVPPEVREGMGLKQYLLNIPGVTVEGHVVRWGYSGLRGPVSRPPGRPSDVSTASTVYVEEPWYAPHPHTMPTDAARFRSQLAADLHAAGASGILLAAMGGRVPVHLREGLSLKDFLMSIPGVVVDGHTVRYVVSMSPARVPPPGSFMNPSFPSSKLSSALFPPSMATSSSMPAPGASFYTPSSLVSPTRNVPVGVEDYFDVRWGDVSPPSPALVAWTTEQLRRYGPTDANHLAALLPPSIGPHAGNVSEVLAKVPGVARHGNLLYLPTQPRGAPESGSGTNIYPVARASSDDLTDLVVDVDELLREVKGQETATGSWKRPFSLEP
jgi:hypothetical protein